MVDKAKPFKDIYKEFIEWSEIDMEPYHLIAWGAKDQQYLFNECKSYKLDTDWLRPYSDLKAQYQRIKKLYEPKGLKHAIESEGWEFDGVQHRAIDDAYNLSKLFLKYFGEWDLHKLEQVI
jgi:inhibitor of KinA sporulation pathway (predicted exonuclease)